MYVLALSVSGGGGGGGGYGSRSSSGRDGSDGMVTVVRFRILVVT